MISLTDLVQVQKRHEEDGLVILALHRSTTETRPEVLQTARKCKWPYPVFFNTDLKGYKLKSPPQVFIFDHSGMAVYDPSDYGYEEKIIRHAEAAPDPLLGDREFEALEREARLLAKGRNLGRLLEDLEKKAASGEDAEKEEAEYLVSRCRRRAERQRQRVDRLIAGGRPKEALELLKDLAAAFRGHPIGEAADKDYKARRRSDEFKRELRAARAVRSLERAYFSFDFEARREDEEAWRKREARALERLRKKFAAFAGKYGGTGSCKRFRTLMGYLEKP